MGRLSELSFHFPMALQIAWRSVGIYLLYMIGQCNYMEVMTFPLYQVECLINIALSFHLILKMTKNLLL